MNKMEVYRRVGCTDQLFGARDMQLLGGKSNGMRAVQLYNAAGMQVLVLPDRGMDIASLSLGGVNISFLSKTGLTSSKYFQENGSKGFLRSFYVGFLTTCGLTYMGAAGKDGEEELGLHGLISNIPADEVSSRVEWDEDTPRIVVSGSVKQAEVFGEHIVLKRQITLFGEKNELVISDSVENRGLVSVPFMLLYHMNYGYPFISPSCQLHLPSCEIAARDDQAKKHIDRWNIIEEPEDDAEEQVFFHKLQANENGNSSYYLINPEIEKGISVSYPSQALPWFTQWKCMRSGEYVLGLEPGNCHVLGRKKARDNGELCYLKPLEKKEVVITVKGFSGKKEINELLYERK